MKVIRRPVLCEALQWTGSGLFQAMVVGIEMNFKPQQINLQQGGVLWIETEVGDDLILQPGEWLVREKDLVRVISEDGLDQEFIEI